MKKIILCILCILVMFNSSYADSKNYHIENYDIVLDIKENGNLEVEEEIEYSFTGAFNGVYRNIVYRKGKNGPKSVKPGNIQYSPKDVNILNVSYFENGVEKICQQGSENNEYEIIPEAGEKKIKLYMKAKDEIKKVKFKYIYSDAAVTHEDCTEIYGDFFSNNERVKNATLKIRGKDILNSKVYPHTSGKNLKINKENNEIVVKVNNVGENNLFDARIVMQHGTCYNSRKIDRENNLKDILKIENLMSKEKTLNKIKGISIIGIIIFSIGISINFIKKYFYLFNKYEKERKSNFNDKYINYIPNKERKAVEAKYIVDMESSNANDILTVLFDLINRKKVKIDIIHNLSKEGKTKIEYSLIRLEEKEKDLLEYEKDTLDFFFNNKKQINLKERIDKIESSKKDASKIENIIKKIDIECKNKYIETIDVKEKILNVKLCSILAIISFILALVIPSNLLYLYDFKLGVAISEIIKGILLTFIVLSFALIPGILSAILNKKHENKITFVLLNICMVIIFAIIMFIICYEKSFIIYLYFCVIIILGNLCGMNLIIKKCERLKEEYIDEKAKFIALKNYINDYSLIKEKEAAHIINWEEYMVYAMAFGIADKVEKELKILYNNGELSELPYYYNYSYYRKRFYAGYISSVNNNTNSNGSYSSGYSSGGGGGFGGGGGAF